jgi:cell division protein FtsQ
VKVKLRELRPYVLPVLGWTLAMLVALLVFQRTEHFLVNDARFVVRPESPDLRLTGVSRTPAAEVRRVFAEDEGRSVFVAPLAERREQLLRIDWIRDATVSRVWPNRIDVRVSERTPAAFVRLPSERRGGPSTPALIDIDGVILPAPEGRGSYELPVLSGIRADQPRAERAMRVRRMRQLLGELGGTAEKVAEVDGADPGNWKVTVELEGRAVTLQLGAGEFGQRVSRFLQHWPEIRRRAPEAMVFDLRLADRITALGAGGGEE